LNELINNNLIKPTPQINTPEKPVTNARGKRKVEKEPVNVAANNKKRKLQKDELENIPQDPVIIPGIIL
jgi:hypothetical protein